MKTRTLFFSSLLLFAPTFVYGACSVANLTRCLDSVCAINIGANPAARYQYCGSSSAGTPEKSTAMKSVSAGTSTKYIISDKELKKAPKDAGQRYIWATEECLKKVSGCTADDITDNYDSLIEQSCTAAGISAEMSNLTAKMNKEKTKTECSREIETCMIANNRCTAGYNKCESDADFDKYFSECGVASAGCDSFLAEIRNNLTSARNSAVANADKILQKIVNAYKTAREQRLASSQNSCKNNKAVTDCVSRVCKNNMPNQCKVKSEGEESIAMELCKFYEIACQRLK